MYLYVTHVVLTPFGEIMFVLKSKIESDEREKAFE
jgi:hypothetical protein